MKLKFAPKAELSSPRSAPVKYSRSWIPTCSSTYPPSVTNLSVFSLTVGTTTPASEVVLPTSLRPEAEVTAKPSLKNCIPAEVLDVTIGERRTDGATVTYAGQVRVGGRCESWSTSGIL